MRNLYVIAVCIVLGTVACSSSAASLIRKKRKSDSRLKSFTDRYALPTNIHSLTSKLPLTYGYRFTDDYGTTQSREEKTDPNGSKIGSYSFVDAAGLYRRVEYVADRHGFRATVSTNEPGTMPVDPAHVRMLADNKHINLGSRNHATGISPQLEFSSHIFSRYNLTSDGYGAGDDGRDGYQSGGYQAGVGDGPPSTYEQGRVQLEDPKSQPITFSREITALIDDLEDPEPVVYVKHQNSNSEKFYNEQNEDYDLNYGDKTPQGEYPKKVPTRYPRGHRNLGARAKSRHAYKIHIPKGYENHPNLPLYKDK